MEKMKCVLDTNFYPTIAEVMKFMGFMEHFGRGIEIAREALEDNGNPQPEFSIEPTFVLATVKKRQ